LKLNKSNRNSKMWNGTMEVHKGASDKILIDSGQVEIVDDMITEDSTVISLRNRSL